MDINSLIIHKKVVPKREAKYAEFPAELNNDIKHYLQNTGIEKLYTHQAEMFDVANNGANVVITTSTASGKTISFLLPVLQRILNDPLSRAIFVYPTKALAADQLRAINEIISCFEDKKILAGVYDGDTSSAERSRIRKSANIILTNPEMLNQTFLPNHSKYGFDILFSHLDYVVIDELHSYKGAFGSHLANLFRRMRRICKYYGSSPQFLCSSATIANPIELANKICGVDFALIDEDGSPSSNKEYLILQPPAIEGNDGNIYGRHSAATVASVLLPQMIVGKHHFIAFGRTRRGVEVILKETRDKLNSLGAVGKFLATLIAGYRGGYTPAERKSIEKKMISKEILGLVSTNALELGIDIGSLDSTIIVGYPGTRASFLQQTGRAGRSGMDCTNYLILENNAFDQYIAIDPGWLFDRESESAIVDPDNLLIELSHIRAAAAEMPLTLDDISLFPDLGEIIPALLNVEEVKSVSGRFIWDGPAFPAGDYSMRNMDRTRFKLILQDDGKEITEMDETMAYHELYPGAIYIHDGVQYEILKLDLISRTATGKLFEGNYYTMPAGQENVRIIQKFKEDEVGITSQHFGDINVTEMVEMFKKLQFHNHQNLGYVTLSQPLVKAYDTESTWINIPSKVVLTYRNLLRYSKGGYVVLNNHFEGLSNALKTAAMMVSMTAQDDIDVMVSNNATIPDSVDDEIVSIYIYDRYEGGLGFSEKIYDLMPQIINNAIKLLKGCQCKDGCPACVGDYNLDKAMVLWGLENLLSESNPPKYTAKNIVEPEQPKIRKQFSFFTLDTNWSDFCEAVTKNGDWGAQFLKSSKNVRIEGHTLIITLNSEFIGQWLEEPDNYNSLINTIKYHAVCPSDLKIETVIEEKTDEVLRKSAKLQRHYDKILDNPNKP